jgi:hypothetical protein
VADVAHATEIEVAAVAVLLSIAPYAPANPAKQDERTSPAEEEVPS